MKKLLSLLAIAGTTTIALTACGPVKADTEITKEKQDSAKNTTLLSTSAIMSKLVDSNPTSLCSGYENTFMAMKSAMLIEDDITSALGIIAEGKAQLKGEKVTEDTDQLYWSAIVGSEQVYYTEQEVYQNDQYIGKFEAGTMVEWNSLTKTSGRGLYAADITLAGSTTKMNTVANYNVSEDEFNIAMKMGEIKDGADEAYALVAVKIIDNSTLVFASLTRDAGKTEDKDTYYAIDLQTGEIATGGVTTASWKTCNASGTDVDYANENGNVTKRLNDIHSGWMSAASWHPEYSTKINTPGVKATKALDIIGDKEAARSAISFKESVEQLIG